MTRLDTARETAGRTMEALTPYAATARETARHYAEEAMHRMGPALDTLGPKAAAAGAQARNGATHAAHAARHRYAKHVAPQIEHAFSSLSPETQQAALKAMHRAQEAALAAKLSAARAAGQAKTVAPKVAEAVESARTTVTPLAHEAQVRGAAAITALHGHVTAAEISELAAKNLKKEQRSNWTTGLAVAGTVAIGSGVLAWQWWRKQSSPEWLVEPPEAGTATAEPGGAHAVGHPGSAEGETSGGNPTDPMMNGSVPSDRTTERPSAEGGNDTAPKPAPPPHRPTEEHPKPHDPRKPH